MLTIQDIIETRMSEGKHCSHTLEITISDSLYNYNVDELELNTDTIDRHSPLQN